MSVQNPQLVGYLLTGNRSNLFYVKGSTAWLFVNPQFLSPLCEADKCFDSILIYHRHTVMYFDPINRQTLNNPQNARALEPDTNEYYVLTYEPVLRPTPMLSALKHFQFVINQNLFTPQEAGICSNAEFTKFCNHVFFTKQSDTTLTIWEKPSCTLF